VKTGHTEIYRKGWRKSTLAMEIRERVLLLEIGMKEVNGWELERVHVSVSYGVLILAVAFNLMALIYSYHSHM